MSRRTRHEALAYPSMLLTWAMEMSFVFPGTTSRRISSRSSSWDTGGGMECLSDPCQGAGVPWSCSSF